MIRGCLKGSLFISFLSLDSKSVGSANYKLRKEHKIVIDSTPICSQFSTLKNYLQANNIKFLNIIVSKDAKVVQEIVRKTSQHKFSQNIINRSIIVSFDKNKMNQILEINLN